jgi:hypothetical protein
MEVKDLRTLLLMAAQTAEGRKALSDDLKISVKYEPMVTNDEVITAMEKRLGIKLDADHPARSRGSWIDAGDEPWQRMLKGKEIAVRDIETMNLDHVTIADFPATAKFLGGE